VLGERPVKPRILLVEDDFAVRDAISLVLKLEGYEVVAVGSLEEARQKAREIEGMDVLVTDYHLSNGETGTQVMAALREQSQQPVKAVLITGDPSLAGENPARERDPYLRVAGKPIRAQELVTLIKNLLATNTPSA